MDIERVIKKIKSIKESAPTNSSGANGFTNAANSAGPVAGYDKRLFPSADDTLSQDYQTPDESGLARYRFSNVYPVEKVNEINVDDMVDASRKYDKMVDEQNSGKRDYMKEKMQKVIETIRSRSLREGKITNDGKKIVNPKKNELIKNEEMAAGGIPTNNASSGAIAGLPPDSPPVKKKKKYVYGGHGSRKMWLVNKK